MTEPEPVAANRVTARKVVFVVRCPACGHEHEASLSLVAAPKETMQ